MPDSTYETAQKAFDDFVEKQSERSPYQQWLAQRRVDLAGPVGNLTHVGDILNNEEHPLAVERAAQIVGQEIERLAGLHRKLVSKALLISRGRATDQ